MTNLQQIPNTNSNVVIDSVLGQLFVSVLMVLSIVFSLLITWAIDNYVFSTAQSSIYIFMMCFFLFFSGLNIFINKKNVSS